MNSLTKTEISSVWFLSTVLNFLCPSSYDKDNNKSP